MLKSSWDRWGVKGTSSMWTAIGFFAVASISMCAGVTVAAICSMAKGDAAEQEYSDKAELEFMRRWRATHNSP